MCALYIYVLFGMECVRFTYMFYKYGMCALYIYVLFGMECVRFTYMFYLEWNVCALHICFIWNGMCALYIYVL